MIAGGIIPDIGEIKITSDQTSGLFFANPVKCVIVRSFQILAENGRHIVIFCPQQTAYLFRKVFVHFEFHSRLSRLSGKNYNTLPGQLRRIGNSAAYVFRF